MVQTEVNKYIMYLIENADLEIQRFDVTSAESRSYINRIFPTYYCMTYQKKGISTFKTTSATSQAKPGSILFIPPGLLHDQFIDPVEPEDKYVCMWWFFTFRVKGTIDVMSFFNIPFVYELQNSQSFELVFKELMDCSNQTDSMFISIMRKAKMFELLYMILEDAVDRIDSHTTSTKNVKFLEILCKIVQNPEHHISLKELEVRMSLNRIYISNRFKELFGVTPISLQRSLLVEKAKKLLLATDEMSITDIASSLNFKETQNFARLFKLHTELSPLQYRKVHRERKPKPS